MSGPGRLNFATLPSNVPWPIRTTNTTSSAPDAASLPNALTTSSRVDFPVARAGSVSGFSFRYCTCALGIPNRFVAASTSEAPHLL